MYSQIRIETLVGRKSDLVWQCWTTPEHITKWNFASDDWCCPSARIELREGGKYCARMESRDGSAGFDFEGVYEKFIPGRKIVFLMDDGRRATTTFESLGDSTRVVTVFDAENQNPEELQQQGWQAILNQFKKHVESL
jgi:uncharacterized protein YndB with AHSA1/START domain